MKAQRRRDTGPELALRSALWRRGRRFRVDYPALGRRSRVDVAFTKQRLAIFVDGCFWHSCPDHGSLPKANRVWWRDKLASNAARDRRVEADLVTAGWTVLRIWEHEGTASAADRIEALLDSSKDSPQGHRDQS
jgi:DNA mismatch endonuclease (patch repair protein)